MCRIVTGPGGLTLQRAAGMAALTSDPARLAHYRATAPADTASLTVIAMAEATLDVYPELF